MVNICLWEEDLPYFNLIKYLNIIELRYILFTITKKNPQAQPEDFSKTTIENNSYSTLPLYFSTPST